MNMNQLYNPLFKGVTLLLLAFYGIATGRSMLPGLCTTLAAAEAGQASVEQSESCCAHESATEKTIGTPSDSYTACALCSLTESISNPFVFTHELPAHIDAHTAQSLQESHPEIPHVLTPAALRAPPLTA
jgi:hypothetical protein